MATAQNPRTFQMPAHTWPMIKRIVRAYGAAMSDESSNVVTVANLGGLHRPIVSANNNFLRSIGILEIDKPKLTAVGVKLATGIGIDNAAIVIEALQEIVRTTPVLAQLLSMLQARGAMDPSAFRGQVILAVGLNEGSPNLPMVKTLIDLMEESKLIENRDDKVFLGGAPVVKDNGALQPGTQNPPASPAAALPFGSSSTQSPNAGTAAWAELLLAKFPDFDPAWTDDVKLKWFDAFDRLMKGRGM